MKRTFIEAEVIAMLRRRQGTMTQLEFAGLIGISKQYLSDIYYSRRSPGPPVLKLLGLEKAYRFKRGLK